jgi:alkaline phosphatase D
VPEGLPPSRALDDYRAHYELHKRVPELQACHAALPWLAMWDDHEVANDYAGGPLRGLAPGRLAAQRRAAYQAWYEHMPLRHAQLVRGVEGLARGGDELRLYGRLAWGRLAALHLLDCRQYRDPQACRGIAGLVDPGSCPGLADPRRGVLGAAQEAWLVERLREQSTGRGRPWTLLLQATMVSPRRIPIGGSHRVWNDGWDGYPAARARLLDAIAGLQVAGPVFVGGDLHENWACKVPAGPGANDPDRRFVASEFVGTGISRSSLAPAAIDAIRDANPHAVYADAGRSGYGMMELRPDRLDVRFRVVDDVWSPDPAIATAASFVVEAGSPLVQRG